MRNLKRTIILVFVLLVAVGASAIAALHSQPPIASKQSSSVESQAPITDYHRPEPADSESRARRQAKSKRYDKENPEKVEELPANVNPLPLITHWWIGLPALPMTQSDVIVLGTITDAQAYLSNDKTGIYSEFAIHVDELLKNSNPPSLTGGSTVEAERPGGAVRFPSGKLQRYSISEQGIPRLGKKYVLFLKSNGVSQNFSIITGYELHERIVFPLDGARSGKGPELPFDIYKGTDEIAFLNTVRDVIAKSLLTEQGGKN